MATVRSAVARCTRSSGPRVTVAAVGGEDADGIGDHDGGDVEPFGPPQGLVQDEQADQGGQDRVDAHEDHEEAGWNPAQGEQVGEKRDRGGEDACGGRVAAGAGVGGWRSRVVIPTGTYTSADRPAAAADPSAPGSPRPITRLIRM
jgi:hypothetical protein